MLAKQDLDIRLIINHENKQSSFVLSSSVRECGRTRQKDPEFGELAGLRVNLYRPGMLLDDDVVTDGEAEPSALLRRV